MRHQVTRPCVLARVPQLSASASTSSRPYPCSAVPGCTSSSGRQGPPLSRTWMRTPADAGHSASNIVPPAAPDWLCMIALVTSSLTTSSTVSSAGWPSPSTSRASARAMPADSGVPGNTRRTGMRAWRRGIAAGAAGSYVRMALLRLSWALSPADDRSRTTITALLPSRNQDSGLFVDRCALNSIRTHPSRIRRVAIAFGHSFDGRSMEFRILGPLYADAGAVDGPAVIRQPLLQSALAVLLLRANRPGPRGWLIQALVGMEPPGSAESSLRVCLSLLGHSL